MDLYVKLHPSSDPKAFANQLKELPERIGVNKEIELRTLPIREIRHHLNEDTPLHLKFSSACLSVSVPYYCLPPSSIS